MRYPLDVLTFEKILGQITAQERAQRQMIVALTFLLSEAMEASEMAGEDGEAPDWYWEAEKLLDLQKRIKTQNENRIFDEGNGYKTETSHIPVNTGMDTKTNAIFNEAEAKEFGGEMSEEEIAKMFNSKPTKKLTNGIDLSAKEPFKGMTLEQIKEWERKQENSNDIYKVKARVANLAVGSAGAALTPVGVMMVNTFVHVVKDLYDFAETIQDDQMRVNLIHRIRKHEGMPGVLIAAATAGVRDKK